MATNFRHRLIAHEKLVGTMLTLPVPAVAEVIADAGFDWLFIDAEHGAMDVHQVHAILQAVDHKIACVVRVPGCDEMWIKRVLDMGAAGIIIPQANSLQTVQSAVQYSRYAPLGQRGVGLGRAHGYGFAFQEYVDRANDDVALIVQAEHWQAVDQIEEIVKVEGVDGVLLGPYDLSASLGKMGQLDDPEVAHRIQHVIDACKAANLPCGSFGVTADSVNSYARSGCSLLAVGTDALLLGQSASAMLSAVSAD